MFQVRDLPEGLSGVSLHFELTEAGEVWIDDVQVSDLEFSDNERIELSKLIALAEYKRASGEVADCLRILDGYWPRFLASYVPRSTTPLADHPAPPKAPSHRSRPSRPNPSASPACSTASADSCPIGGERPGHRSRDVARPCHASWTCTRAAMHFSV